jgi:hypothetical protein
MVARKDARARSAPGRCISLIPFSLYFLRGAVPFDADRLVRCAARQWPDRSFAWCRGVCRASRHNIRESSQYSDACAFGKSNATRRAAKVDQDYDLLSSDPLVMCRLIVLSRAKGLPSQAYAHIVSSAILIPLAASEPGKPNRFKRMTTMESMKNGREFIVFRRGKGLVYLVECAWRYEVGEVDPRQLPYL